MGLRYTMILYPVYVSLGTFMKMCFFFPFHDRQTDRQTDRHYYCLRYFGGLHETEKAGGTLLFYVTLPPPPPPPPPPPTGCLSLLPARHPILGHLLLKLCSHEEAHSHEGWYKQTVVTVCVRVHCWSASSWPCDSG